LRGNKNIPKGIKPPNFKWVFSIKDNGIYKARLLIKYFHQIKGTDYNYIYSPTIEIDSSRTNICYCISIYKKFKTNQY